MNLEQRHERLEEKLEKNAQIRISDRVKDFGDNVKENAKYLIPLGTGIAATATGIWAVAEFTEIASLTETYKNAYIYLNGLGESLETAVTEHIAVNLSPDMLELPQKLIEEGSQNIYEQDGREILEEISDNIDLFSNEGELQPAVEFTEKIKEKLQYLAQPMKQTAYRLGSGLTLVGVGGIFYGGSYAQEETYWLNHRTSYKKAKQNEIKNDLPKLKQNLATHPYASEAYTFLQNCPETVDVYQAAEFMKNYTDNKYESAFKDMALNPEEYNNYKTLRDAFKKVDDGKQSNDFF